MILIGESGIGLYPRRGELQTVPESEIIKQIIEDSFLACRGQGAGKSLHDPGPDEHSSIGHSRHMHHLSVDTQQ